VRENRYDILFIDHLMPEMDGVETTAAIRAIKGGYFKEVPIIALTANAVSGMREMFLKSGFSDYLAKPIEISKLNEIMEKWLPAAKRVKAAARAAASAEEPTIRIEGADVKRGIAMTGGTESGYIDVLALFCRDAEERLSILENTPDENALPLFITQVHALKSASASIGASAVSGEAEFLEGAGHRGDMAAIGERLDGFRESVSALVTRIRAALPPEQTGETANGAELLDFDFYKELLPQLKEALEAEDVGAADTILEELSAMPLDAEIKKSLSEVSDYMLLAEFKEAAGIIERLP
jgi:CheY-like chemotaxis protein